MTLVIKPPILGVPFQFSTSAVLYYSSSEEVISFNPSLTNLLGYSEIDLVNSPYEPLIETPISEIKAFLSFDAQDSISSDSISITFRHKSGCNLVADLKAYPNMLPGIHILFVESVEAIDTLSNVKLNTIALKRRKRFFVRIFDNIPIDIEIYTNDYKYIYANQWAIKDELLRESILGKTHKDYCLIKKIPTEVIEKRCKLFFEAIDTKQNISFEDCYQKDGNCKYMNRNFIPIYSRNNEFLYVISYSFDVTEIRRAEVKANEKEEFYRYILDKLPICVALKNKEGDYLFQNKVQQALYINKDDLTEAAELEDYEQMMRFIAADDATTWSLSGQLFRTYNRIRGFKGQKNYYEIGKIIIEDKNKQKYLLGYASDKTAIAIAEAAKDHANRLTERVVESVRDGIVQIDATGKIVSWNKHAEEIFDYSLNEARELSFDSLIVENSISHLLYNDSKSRSVFDLLKAGSLSEKELIECQVRRKNGTVFFVEMYAKRLEPNEPALYIAFIRNITHRKEHEQELRTAFDLVSEQNKRLLNFSYIISHNLRSHSGNIESLVSFLNGDTSPEDRKMFIQLLSKVSLALSETIKKLNDVVTIQTENQVKPENLNLHEYIGKAAEIVLGEFNGKSGIIVNNVPKDLVVKYNKAYLESILLNLLSNSFKYGYPDRFPLVTLSSYYDAEERLTLVVKDNGLGINMELYGSKLFGMYKTFHGNKDAKGLGLFITKNQVEAMGGKIEVISEVDKGTTFFVTLG